MNEIDYFKELERVDKLTRGGLRRFILGHPKKMREGDKIRLTIPLDYSKFTVTEDGYPFQEFKYIDFTIGHPDLTLAYCRKEYEPNRGYLKAPTTYTGHITWDTTDTITTFDRDHIKTLAIWGNYAGTAPLKRVTSCGCNDDICRAQQALL